MKAVAYLGASILALATFVAPLQANGSQTKEFDRVKTTVVQCGFDPDGDYECVTTHYDDGSDCTIIDHEEAPSGIMFFGCE